MSRSYRKPYYSWGKGSMRFDKDLYHRRHRAKVRASFETYQDLEEIYVSTKYRETSDIYCMVRDGKQKYMKRPTEELLKKTYKKIKRK